jgi:2-keto-4-pentenoate hydratase
MRAELTPERFRAGMERQLAALDTALAGGMSRCGWKIGINVPEIQARLGLTHPGVGWLDGRCVLSSGARLEAPASSRLHVEPEIALEIAASLGADASLDAARRSIASVRPALEIVDYGIHTRGLVDVIAHSMFHHAVVLGAPCSPTAEPELGTRWPTLAAGLHSAAPSRRDLVADLAEVVQFVAAYLAAFGRTLAAGDLVLSGSYLAEAVPVAPGDDIVARFGALGSVSLTIVGPGSG